jgi:hypothetical protein
MNVTPSRTMIDWKSLRMMNPIVAPHSLLVSAATLPPTGRTHIFQALRWAG